MGDLTTWNDAEKVDQCFCSIEPFFSILNHSPMVLLKFSLSILCSILVDKSSLLSLEIKRCFR